MKMVNGEKMHQQRVAVRLLLLLGKLGLVNDDQTRDRLFNFHCWYWGLLDE